MHSPSNKIFYASDDAAQGMLLVRLSTADAMPTIEDVDITFEPLFNGVEDAKLSRWMIAKFDETLDLGTVAELLAGESCVERIEYDVRIKPIKSEALPMPTSRPEPTRSVTMPFDDPEFAWSLSA